MADATPLPGAYVNKRTAHRWRVLGLLLAGVLCAFGSFWLVQVMQRGDEAGNVDVGNDPDYIIDNFSFVRMSEAGKPAYVISGARLAHRPVDNTSEIEQPVVQSLTKDHPPMTMTAKHAHVSQDQARIELTGSVDLRRPGAANSQPLHVETEAMTLLTDDEIAQTDKPIRMQIGTAHIDAVGMVANNATMQVKLSGGIHITYPPHTPR